MNTIPYDIIDRTELGAFLDQEVSFQGIVVRTTAPTPDQKFACIRNVRIAELNNDVVFNDRNPITIEHIWLDISRIKHIKTRIADEIVGSGTVFQYTRKDGSVSYCIRFVEKGLTEQALMSRFIDAVNQIRSKSAQLPVAKQHTLVQELIRKIEAMALSGKVYFHDMTQGQFLKELRKRKGQIMRSCGVVLPNNRAGRRFHGEQRVARRCKTPCLKGFA